MSDLWIDTDAAHNMATAWAARGDELAGSQLAVETDLERLQLGTVQSAAVQHVAFAATELWVDSAFLRLLVERVTSADVVVDVIDVLRLRDEAGHRVRHSVMNACLPLGQAPPYSPADGDLAGTFDGEVRSPFYAIGATPEARGRSVIARALADTSTAAQIRKDEFELIDLANGSYVLVLPGVIDLSSPHLGLDDTNRSARDLDQHAVPSSMTTSIDDNRYAQLVRDALAANDVPAGSTLMLVGHSFGADTALDLAADEAFNGPGGYQVTHVVAAGYYSDPQLEHVDPGTEVLVLQNNRDAAVIAEAVGHHHVSATAHAAASAWDDLTSSNPAAAVDDVADVIANGAGAFVDGVRYTVGNIDDLAEIQQGVATFDGGRIVDGLSDFVTPDPGISTPSNDQIVDVFAGGGDGVGHHPDNYIDHVLAVDDDRLTAFFVSVDAAGYAAPGTSWAIDISVPS